MSGFHVGFQCRRKKKDLSDIVVANGAPITIWVHTNEKWQNSPGRGPQSHDIF